MKPDPKFITHLSEVFSLLGSIRAKRMFGGYGVYHQDLMFGLVADDVLYLKVDALSAHDFEKAGSAPFEYTKNGVAMKMSYVSAPTDIYDDLEAAEYWAKLALEAALRSRARIKKR